MAYSKSFVVVIFTYFFVGLSHGIDLDKNMIASFLASGVGGDSISVMQCVQKLILCQPALASRTKNPPATCCAPLKEIITNDTQCLCTVFANSNVMKNMNVTQHEALDFAKACGAKPDFSLCKKDLSSEHLKDSDYIQISLESKKKKKKKKADGSDSASAPSPTPSETDDSISDNKTTSPPAENTASVTSKFGGFVVVASLMSLVMLLAF